MKNPNDMTPDEQGALLGSFIEDLKRMSVNDAERIAELEALLREALEVITPDTSPQKTMTFGSAHDAARYVAKQSLIAKLRKALNEGDSDG